MEPSQNDSRIHKWRTNNPTWHPKVIDAQTTALRKCNSRSFVSQFTLNSQSQSSTGEFKYAPGYTNQHRLQNPTNPIIIIHWIKINSCIEYFEFMFNFFTCKPKVKCQKRSLVRYSTFVFYRVECTRQVYWDRHWSHHHLKDKSRLNGWLWTR